MAERILIPLDGSKLGEAALHYVEQMIDNLGPSKKSEVTLIQVVSPPVQHVAVDGGVLDIPEAPEYLKKAEKQAADYLEKAGKVLKEKGIKVKTMVKVSEGSSAAEAIIDAEAETKADLVAMSTHGRRGISRWAFGSVTEKVLQAGKVPVLMVRAKNG